MGPLHHDEEFFNITDLHYHIDPRFLSGAAARRAERDQLLDKAVHRDTWHPAFQQIASWFPYTDEAGQMLAFSLTSRETRVADRKLRRVCLKSSDWGLSRIRKRTTSLICRRALEPPTVDRRYSDDGFHELRRHYGRKCRDVCPHRGYDLTNIPIDDKGFRQCPLHQLRVRAPKTQRNAR